MGIQTHFDKFDDKIKLGREHDAYKKARDRDDSIRAEVKTAFSEAGYPVVGDFIQGSLKTHTGIVPLSGDYDIDRALVIDQENAPENPVTPKKKALDVLEGRGFKNAKIKKPCVTADYASDNVHIDFIIYKRSGNQHYLAVGKKNSDEDNREWSVADPLGLMDWIDDTSDYDEDEAKDMLAQFRRLVRYLKRWRHVQFSDTVAAKVFSIGLTVMAKRELVPAFSTAGARKDLMALRATVEAILDAGYFDEEETGRYRVRVDLPVEPCRDIFDGSSLDTGTQFHNKLQRLKNRLAERSHWEMRRNPSRSSSTGAADNWRRSFVLISSKRFRRRRAWFLVRAQISPIVKSPRPTRYSCAGMLGLKSTSPFRC